MNAKIGCNKLIARNILRKEAIAAAEKDRHKKYRKQDEERETVRQVS